MIEITPSKEMALRDWVCEVDVLAMVVSPDPDVKCDLYVP